MSDDTKLEAHPRATMDAVREALLAIEGSGCQCRGDDHEDGCHVLLARNAPIFLPDRHPDLTRVTVVGEISDEMVERALYAYWQKDRHAQAFNFHDRGSMRAALTAALLPSAAVKE